jgi:hypothetical protein
MSKKIWIIVMVFIISGCMSVAPVNARSVNEPQNINRYYDAEADVVCWWFSYDGQSQYGARGLSCLPRSQTNLSVEQLGAH